MMTQAKLLASVSAMYSGDEKLVHFAKQLHNDTTRFCHFEWTRSGPVDEIATFDDYANQNSGEWMKWQEKETRKRTGYSVWVIKTTPKIIMGETS
jgi:hypothetical protein